MILNAFSSDLIDFLKELESLGFCMTLVGGAVREYILNGSISNDLDFEIRSAINISESDWPNYYSKIYSFLDNKKIKYEKLPYLITRFEFDGKSLELSSPRIELIKDGNLSHHHFEAILDANIDYKSAFKRRDFTINSIGMELDFKNLAAKIVDPFNGISDLKNKELKNISNDFFSDYVRFLRLVRFKVKLDFKISNEIINEIDKFNLNKMSDHYFFNEMYKVDCYEYLDLFFILNSKLKRSVPEKYEILKYVKIHKVGFKKEDLMDYLICLNSVSENQVVELYPNNKNEINIKKKIIDLFLGIENFKITFNFQDFQNSNQFKILKSLKNKEKFLNNIKEFNFTAFFPLVELSQLIETTKLNSEEVNSIPTTKRSDYLLFKIWKIWIADSK